ncbi:hypothetical protein [Leptonema illini]|uniref:hypothetical protein n=1 Tax=Leptonema illini TaxID=183 RepID=UPI0011798ED8|nr:hypothetical protein [Leptonema illini]
MKQVRKGLNILYDGPGKLPALIELQGLLPIFDDYGQEKLVSNMGILAWNRPGIWLALQSQVAQQFDDLVSFFLTSSTARGLPESSPPFVRLASLISLVTYTFAFASRAVRNRMQATVIRILQNLEQLSSADRPEILKALRYLFDWLLDNRTAREKADILSLLPLNVWISMLGEGIIEQSVEQWDNDVWECISIDIRTAVVKHIQDNADRNPSFFFPLLAFARRGGDDHPVLNAVISGVERFRENESAHIEKQVKDAAEKTPGSRNIAQLEKELDELKRHEHYTDKDLRGWLLRIGRVKEPFASTASVSFIENLRRSLSKQSFGITSLGGIFSFLRTDPSDEEKQALAELIPEVIDRERKSPKGGWRLVQGEPVLEGVAAYYWHCEMYDAWFDLMEEFGVFLYPMNAPDLLSKMRAADEESSKGYVERLLLHALSVPRRNDRLEVLHILEDLVLHARLVLPADIRSLAIISRNPDFVDYRPSLFAILATAMLKHSDDEVSFHRVCSTLEKVLKRNSLQISPWALSRFLDLFEVIKPRLTDGSSLLKSIHNAEEKFAMLDFRYAPLTKYRTDP